MSSRVLVCRSRILLRTCRDWLFSPSRFWTRYFYILTPTLNAMLTPPGLATIYDFKRHIYHLQLVPKFRPWSLTYMLSLCTFCPIMEYLRPSLQLPSINSLLFLRVANACSRGCCRSQLLLLASSQWENPLNGAVNNILIFIYVDYYFCILNLYLLFCVDDGDTRVMAHMWSWSFPSTFVRVLGI